MKHQPKITLRKLQSEVERHELEGMSLRALREGTGLSQSRFADVIGSTQSSINRYENGQATPTVELLRKYADYFDVSMDCILSAAMIYKARCMRQILRSTRIIPNRRGLYRVKQFFETYKDDEFVTPLVTQISWTNCIH